mgnify:CR=1 FL=1
MEVFLEVIVLIIVVLLLLSSFFKNKKTIESNGFDMPEEENYKVSQDYKKTEEYRELLELRSKDSNKDSSKKIQEYKEPIETKSKGFNKASVSGSVVKDNDKSLELSSGSQALVGELVEDTQDHYKLTEEVHHFYHHKVSNEYSSKRQKSDSNRGHSKKVWERLGYRIKPGETYSYRYYGNEIFEPNQVEEIGKYRHQIQKTGLTERQLKVKTLGSALVKKTGSKRAAKDILVSEYGFEENTAKYAVGYHGYNDY